ncbi:MAG TPA: PQQ-binding-like beta-propeller repeat protein [Polyangiaceae bacterium]
MKLRSLLIWPIFLMPRLVAGQAVSVAVEAPSAVAGQASGYPLPRFRFDAGAPLDAPAGVASDGSVCVGTADGYIHALSPDGSYRWSYSVHGAVLHRPLFASGLWYIATSANRIYALTRDGSLYWVFKPPSTIDSELALDEGGLLFFAATDRYLYGVTSHGGVSVRAQLGELKAGPSTAPDGAVWAENQAGSFVRVRGFEVRRLGPEAMPGFELGPSELLRDPEGRFWQVREGGVLEFRAGVDAQPTLTVLTSAPLFSPIWSSATRCAIVSARNGLVVAVDPPRSKQSR